MNHKKIRRIMKAYGLYCKIRRRNPYKAIMKKGQEHLICPNLLNRQFLVATARKVLCTDITYLYFALGRIAYLSVIKDLATGEILAWKLSLNLELEFVIETVRQLRAEELANDCLLYSDQGCHYTSLRYQAAVKALNISVSMSRKGNCIDNASMESFFGHCKDELEFQDCKTFEELTIKVSQYMQYYNCERPQWDLNKMTPAAYRDHLVAAIAA